MAQPAAVPEDYRCPLCPDHKDDEFFHSKIVGAPICAGCDGEISFFVEEAKRPADFLLDRLEALTGLTFREYKRIAFEEFIEDFEHRMQAENVKREARVAVALGLSLEDLMQRYRQLIEDYRAEIRRLDAERGGP